MTKREIINFCLTLPDTYKDYPFFDTSSNPTTVMRHHYNQKSFALIIHHDNKTYLNLKHNPFEIEFLRDIYKSIIPGWHMNKKYWLTIIVDKPCDVSVNEIKGMIKKSYELTCSKKRKKINYFNS